MGEETTPALGRGIGELAGDPGQGRLAEKQRKIVPADQDPRALKDSSSKKGGHRDTKHIMILRVRALETRGIDVPYMARSMTISQPLLPQTSFTWDCSMR